MTVISYNRMSRLSQHGTKRSSQARLSRLARHLFRASPHHGLVCTFTPHFPVSNVSSIPVSTGYSSSDASGAQWTWTQQRIKLCRRVLIIALNAAARVVSSTHKYDRGLSRLLRPEIYWLDVHEEFSINLAT